MSENKMEQVAALFGKKLGEEFKVKCVTGVILACKFTGNGLWCRKEEWDDYDWFVTDSLIMQMIRGEATIIEDKVKWPWKITPRHFCNESEADLMSKCDKIYTARPEKKVRFKIGASSCWGGEQFLEKYKKALKDFDVTTKDAKSYGPEVFVKIGSMDDLDRLQETVGSELILNFKHKEIEIYDYYRE